MKKFALAGLTALMFCGCTLNTVPVVPPQPNGASCETAHTNLEKLGGCGANLSRFVTDCHDRAAYEAEHHGSILPLDCLSRARTCEEARVCT
jgi:hypothetical protein